MAFTSATITLSKDGRDIWGKTNIQLATFLPTASDYTTGGYLMTAAMFAMRVLTTVVVVAQGGTSLTTAFVGLWNTTTPGLQFFSSAGFTPAGTNAAPVVTIAGGAGGGALTVNPESNSGVLTHNAGGTLTIPGATFGIAAPVFTGSAVAAAGLVEVAASTDLSAFTYTLIAYGND